MLWNDDPLAPGPTPARLVIFLLSQHRLTYDYDMSLQTFQSFKQSQLVLAAIDAPDAEHKILDSVLTEK